MIDKQKQGHIKHTRKYSQCYTHDDTHRLTMTHNETQIIIDKPLKRTSWLKFLSLLQSKLRVHLIKGLLYINNDKWT